MGRRARRAEPESVYHFEHASTLLARAATTHEGDGLQSMLLGAQAHATLALVEAVRELGPQTRIEHVEEHHHQSATMILPGSKHNVCVACAIGNVEQPCPSDCPEQTFPARPDYPAGADGLCMASYVARPGALMEYCHRPSGHDGQHSWEAPANLQAIEPIHRRI